MSDDATPGGATPEDATPEGASSEGASSDGALEQLLSRARGPMGPAIDLDFGWETGPLAELGTVLSSMNGFFLFNAGVQVFRAGDEGLGPDLLSWNAEDTWKDTYDDLADDIFCFGQDIFGTQFGIIDGAKVVTLNPESAELTELGTSLNDWAQWLLDDPDVNGTASFAYAYQKANGALDPAERLVPRRFFVAGGGYDFDNFKAVDAATAMRIRGPIAQQVFDLPDGATLRLPSPNPFG
ncbi:SMI1/KNR4 family protein [Streptomyces endophyticus]|uniref:SMI1/KNR4 family protein n=1 Tax=Streptomyces endophyticus TaxID=714166 RepID=A0ABU6FFQ4_9ACTN|nr:SMI1/KNR4 family protein [Streptomyces endophyticus]MEB8342679.1 SMI1/KNR4 family protein [Streptomyces endophyticus]